VTHSCEPGSGGPRTSSKPKSPELGFGFGFALALAPGLRLELRFNLGERRCEGHRAQLRAHGDHRLERALDEDEGLGVVLHEHGHEQVVVRDDAALQLAVLLASATLSASCSERLGDYEHEPDDPRLACAPISVEVQGPNGGVMWLLDENYEHDWWCTCVPEDEIDDELREWVNERAYVACVEFVERLGYDPELSTCGEFYDEGRWGWEAFARSPGDIEYCDQLGEPPAWMKLE